MELARPIKVMQVIARMNVGGPAVLVGGEQKIVLEALDSISVVSSAATSADVIVSALELT